MQNKIKKLEPIVGPGRLKYDEPLNQHTANKSGGPAGAYIEIEKLEELIKTVNAARQLEIPIFLLGMGTWVTIPEEGFPGLVIKNNCRRFDLLSFRGKIQDQQIGVQHALVYAESGTNMNQLVRFTIGEGLAGLEYQLGLPGTVGGAINVNTRYTPKSIHTIHALEKVRLLTQLGEITEVPAEHFAKQSNMQLKETQEIILAAYFRLKPEDKKLLWERAQEAVTFRNKVI